MAEELYEVPADGDGRHSPTTYEVPTATDECDGRDAAAIAAAIANAQVPKKKRGFIQRLFRTPSKIAANEKIPAATHQISEDIRKDDAPIYDETSQSSQKESNQEDYLCPGTVPYDDARVGISEPDNDIYDDVYACQTHGSTVDSTEDYEAPKQAEHENLEAKENFINRQFDIGNMQDVFDKVGIDAKLYDDATAVKTSTIPEMFLPISFGQLPEEVAQEEEYDCIAGETAQPEPANDDTDNVSVKSATSDYADYNQKWHISVPEAIKKV